MKKIIIGLSMLLLTIGAFSQNSNPSGTADTSVYGWLIINP